MTLIRDKRQNMRDYKIQFEQKTLAAAQTVAELLASARQRQGLEIGLLAEELQISPFYLEALEQGHYGLLPSLVYSRNFLKRYAHRLGLPLSPLMQEFEKEWALFDKHQQPLLSEQSRPGVKSRDFWRMPRWIRWSAACLSMAAIVSYLGIELYSLRQAPSLVVFTPQEELITDRQIVHIEGKTEPEVTLSINDQTILSDAEGNFEESVALQPGLNIVEIKAQKKYSQISKVYRKIMVENGPVMTDTGDGRHQS